MANSSSRNRELKQCIFLEPDTSELPSKFVVFEIVLRKANADNRDTCAFVANLLILLNFGFKDVLTNRLAELGITEIKTVKIPSQAEEYMLSVHCTTQQTIEKLVPFVANLLILVNPGFKDVLTNRLTELGISEINTVKNSFAG
ncbi:hypothetical protein H5410_017208 [Solanum commersonii]|uniref:Uncharacterized protein n=1 Tax=Solanum commersonii TaxID=4109 RepID=A0A9J5ZYS3_SOLCO|nr:hypothetical protein H5410_017208 [Solanum commersonii]